MCGAPIWSRFDAKHLKGTLGWLLVSNWRETREFALYELVIARGGPKLAPAVARLPSTKLDPADPDSRDTHSLSGTKFRRSCESLLVWNGKSMYRMITLLVATGFVIARAQTFEVASVKIPPPHVIGQPYNIAVGIIQNDTITFTNASLADCIRFAYG